MATKDTRFQHLPDCAEKYIRSVVRRIGNTLKVRREVCDELIDHFTHAAADCDEAERLAACRKLIEDFGDAKLLAKLIRRGKKRCRPLWRTAIVRGFQAAGLLIVLCGLYTWYLATGEATISVDYLTMLNAYGRPAASEDQNAWPDYERAMDAYVAPAKDIRELARRARETFDGPVVDFAELDASQQAAIRQWLKVNEPAWREFQAGSTKPHHWIEFSFGDPDVSRSLISLPLPKLQAIRILAASGIWRSRIAMRDGRIDQAIDYCLTVGRCGRHFANRSGFLTEQLYAMVINTQAHQQMLRIAHRGKMSAGQFARAQRELEALYPDGYPMVDVEGERLGFRDLVQHNFTLGGPGGGHMISGREQMAEVPEVIASEGARYGLQKGALLTLGGMFFAGRDETVRMGDGYYRQMNRIIKLSPHQLRAQGLKNWSSEYLRSVSVIRFPFRMFLPSLIRAGELAYRAKARHEATITVLAVRRWRLEKGQYPQDLQELLQAGYLKSLPADPYSDGPLKYKRRGDDFVLYSVGEDFTDDDAPTAPPDPLSRRGKAWSALGNPDWVFWPIE